MDSTPLTAAERAQLLSVIQQSRATLLSTGNEYDVDCFMRSAARCNLSQDLVPEAEMLASNLVPSSVGIIRGMLEGHRTGDFIQCF
jgi:hypothetical protein